MPSIQEMIATRALLQYALWAVLVFALAGHAADQQLVQSCASGATGTSFVQLASRASLLEGRLPVTLSESPANGELLRGSLGSDAISARQPLPASEELRPFAPEAWARWGAQLGSDAFVVAVRSWAGAKKNSTNKQDQGVDVYLDSEELGPAAAALSLLESFLERPHDDSLRSPDGKGDDLQSWLLWLLAGIGLSMLFMLVPFVGLGTEVNCCGDIIGLSIKAGIEKFDKSYLGVDVEIGHLTVNPFDGYLDITNLIVLNPPGYSSKYLLKASQVLIDIDMLRLLKSGMSVVSVDKLVFKDINAIYEKKWSTSNMQEVMNHINKASEADQPLEESSDTDEVTYETHRVEVVNVGVTVRPSGTVGEYVHLNMEAGDVHYKDFNAEIGHIRIKDIVRELLRSILKTVLVNIAGQNAGEYLVGDHQVTPR